MSHDTIITDTTINDVFFLEIFANRTHNIGKSFSFDSKIMRIHTEGGIIEFTLYSNGALTTSINKKDSPYNGQLKK